MEEFDTVYESINPPVEFIEYPVSAFPTIFVSDAEERVNAGRATTTLSVNVRVALPAALSAVITND